MSSAPIEINQQDMPLNVPPAKRQRNDGDQVRPSISGVPTPQQQFRCNLCNKTFTSSSNLQSHMEIQATLTSQRDPQIDNRILQSFLNENIEVKCKICSQSIVLNNILEHMIESHEVRDERNLQSSPDINLDNPETSSSSNTPQPLPHARTTDDVQKVIKDLNLETINFDEEFDVSLNNNQ